MNWVNRNSLDDVDQLSPDTYKIYEMLRLPMLLAFTDTESEFERYKQKSLELLETLRGIAPRYHGVIITYIDGEKYSDRKRQLGISWDELPAVGFNSNDGRAIAFPRTKEMTAKNLIKFIQKSMTGELKNTAPKGQPVNSDLLDLLPNAERLDTESFVENVLEEGIDAFILIYQSDNAKSFEYAQAFNTACERLKDYSDGKMFMGHHDVASEGFPPGIDVS